MKFDLVIKGGVVVDPINHLEERTDIGIKDGRIAEIKPELKQAEDMLDASGRTVIPGVIDMHVHVTKLLGGQVGYYMAAKTGVTTIIDFAGPISDVVENFGKLGCGMNVGCVDAVLPDIMGADPSRSEIQRFLEHALGQGALGLKILGGHFPLTPDASRICVEEANKRRVMIACHAGSTENRSDIYGLREAFGFAEGGQMLMVHINAYCRGNRYNYLEELRDAFQMLRDNPNVIADSHMAVNNGTSGICLQGVPKDGITVNCLKMFGYEPTKDGLAKGIREGKIKVIAAMERENILLEKEDAYRHWTENDTNVNVSFPANLSSVAAACLTERRVRGGDFLIALAATDGGGFPRNGLLEKLLAFHCLGYLSLEEVIEKCSINPARTFGLTGKGHLGIGADADLTVVDLSRSKAAASVAAGAVVMRDGQVVGTGGRLIIAGDGEREAKRRSLNYQVADLENCGLYKN